MTAQRNPQNPQTPRGWKPGLITTACVKCGDESGFRDSKPLYRSSRGLNLSNLPAPYDEGEWLEWTCTTCGYTAQTSTADNGGIKNAAA
jgi:predicted nucleic-acid-binding Zn-ribbon protein